MAVRLGGQLLHRALVGGRLDLGQRVAFCCCKAGDARDGVLNDVATLAFWFWIAANGLELRWIEVHR